MARVGNRSGSSAALAVAIAAISAVPAQECAEYPVDEQTTLESAVSGEVELGTFYEPLLELPHPDCPEGAYACIREQRYGQLYDLRFVALEFPADSAADSAWWERDAGRLLVATDLDEEEESRFEEILVGRLSSLSGTAFRNDYAGIFPGAPLRAAQAVGRSGRPAWACLLGALSTTQALPLFYRATEEGERSPERPKFVFDRESICGTLQRAAESAATERFRSPVDVRQLRVTRLYVSSDWFPGSGGAEAYHPAPEASRFVREPWTPETQRPSLRKLDDGRYATSMKRQDRQYSVETGPSEVALLDESSAVWVARFRWERAVRQFRTDMPWETVDRSQSFWIALLPIQEAGNPEPADPQDPSYNDWWLGTATSLVDPEATAAELVVSMGAMLTYRDEDWMAVLCMEDDSARYTIPPFPTLNEVENGEKFCRELRERYACEG